MNQYVDFEVIKEPWNKYKLEDDTIIKIKAVLKRIQQDTSKDDKLYCNPDTDIDVIIVAHSAPSLNAEPDKRNWTLDDLHNNIDSNDMSMRAIEREPNEYRLDNGAKATIQTDLIKVSRTKLYNRQGERIYLTETKFELNITKPNN